MARSAFRQGRRFTTPLALAAVSIVSALALWVAVTQAQNPNQTTVFGGAIEVKPINVPEGLAVASIKDPVVSLRISAPESTIKNLTSNDFRAEVDLSGVRQSTSDLRVLARVVGHRDVGIIEVQPAFVTVVLEASVTRNVSVRPKPIGAPPQGYTAGEISADPQQVKVTGAQSLVQLVGSVDADVNLTGLRTSIRQQYTLVPRDSRGGDIKGLTLDPPNATLNVTIVQQAVQRTLPVLPSVQGTIADGYDLISISTDTQAVVISGPLETLQAMSSVTTDPIDVSQLRADTTRAVRLHLPAGVTADHDSVSVRLHIVPAPGQIALSIAPTVTGLGEGLHYDLQTVAVTVTVGGDVPTLRALQASAVKVTVNVAGMGEGVQVVKPSVTVPDNVQLISVDPPQVVLTLHK